MKALLPVLVLALGGQFIFHVPAPPAGGDTGTACADAVIAGTIRYTKTASSGTGDGSSWTNAIALPSNPTRGLVYCLADGSYGGQTWTTANSGTTTITIAKATVADHGTSTGWSDTMGDGQAVFGFIQIQTDYWILNGQRRNSTWRAGAITEYGIKIDVSGGKGLRLDNGSSSSGADTVTLQYVDIEGGGLDTQDADADGVYGLYASANITFRYCAIHDFNRTLVLTRGDWVNLTFDQCYLARNASHGCGPLPQSGCTINQGGHGELHSLTEGTNLVYSNNVIEDTEGTGGIFAALNNGTLSGAKIYGNTYRHSPAYQANTGRLPCGSGGDTHNCGVSAPIYCADDASQTNICNNVLVYNNTFVEIMGNASIHIENGSGNLVKNNMWYDAADASHAGVTSSHNWYFSTTNSDSTNIQTCSSGCDIFVNRTSGDFHLTEGTNAGDNSIGSPYNVDADGVTRGSDGTWDRGALEFDASPPAPLLSFRRIIQRVTHGFD